MRSRDMKKSMRTRRRSYSLTPLQLYPAFASVIERFTRDGLAFDPDGYIVPVLESSCPDGSMHSTRLLGALLGGGDGCPKDTPTTDMSAFVNGCLEGIDPMAIELPARASWAMKRLVRFIRDIFGLFHFPFPDQVSSPFHLIWRKTMTGAAAARTAYFHSKAAYRALHGDGCTLPWSSYLSDELHPVDGQWRSCQGGLDRLSNCTFDYRVVMSSFPASEQQRVRMVGRAIGIDPLSPVPFPLMYAAILVLVPEPPGSDDSHFAVRLYSASCMRAFVMSASIVDPSTKFTRSCAQIRAELDSLRSTVGSLQRELDSRSRRRT